MTNQDVINFLNQARKILLDDKSWIESAIKPINEAFDLAISTLQAQDVPDTNAWDTISRQAAIDALDKRFDSVPMEQTTEILLLRRDLRNLPSVQPERKRGHWEIYVISMLDGKGCKCSECGSEGVPHWVSCPNCDAKMEGEK